MKLYDGVVNKDKKSISRLMTLVEEYNEEGLKIYDMLYKRTGNGRVIGITGPPGCGKSTLLNLIVKKYIDDGHSTGVIAIDPTSPFTGGAVLGDRIRMNDIAGNESCFIRSMGSRGELGGVSKGAVTAVDILDAAGFEYIFVETVGTGQVGIDISKYADMVIVVTAPGLGDDIQAFKAGLMEIGDIIVINKCDMEASEKTLNYMQSAISLFKIKPQLALTDCTNNKGIEELKLKIDMILLKRASGGGLEERRRVNRIERFRAEACELFLRTIRSGHGVDKVLYGLDKGMYSPIEAARLVIKIILNQEGEYDIQN